MITVIENHILESIDHTVDTATDDELFAGGYLRGHLTLAVAELEQQQATDPELLRLHVEESLAQAIQAGELSPPDQVLVSQMWADLYQRAMEAASR